MPSRCSGTPGTPPAWPADGAAPRSATWGTSTGHARAWPPPGSTPCSSCSPPRSGSPTADPARAPGARRADPRPGRRRGHPRPCRRRPRPHRGAHPRPARRRAPRHRRARPPPGGRLARSAPALDPVRRRRAVAVGRGAARRGLPSSPRRCARCSASRWSPMSCAWPSAPSPVARRRVLVTAVQDEQNEPSALFDALEGWPPIPGSTPRRCGAIPARPRRPPPGRSAASHDCAGRTRRTCTMPPSP